MKRWFCLIIALMVASAFPVSAMAFDESKVTWLGSEAEFSDLMELQFSNGLRKFKANDKYGFSNKSGKVVVPAIYSSIGEFKDGYAETSIKGEGVGIISSSGKVIVPAKYDKVGMPSDGMIGVVKDGLTGYYSTSGAEVIKPKYKSSFDFSSGRLRVINGEKWGFIDKKGKLVIPYKYDAATDFRGNRAGVWSGGYAGVIDENGKNIVPVKYYDGHFLNSSPPAKQISPVYIYDEMKCIVIKSDTAKTNPGRKQAGRAGVLSFSGKKVVPFEYAAMRYLPTENALVAEASPENTQKNGRWEVFDKSGKSKTKGIMYGFVNEAFNGMRVVYNTKSEYGRTIMLYGALDEWGTVKVPLKYEGMTDYNKYGYAWAKKNGKWGMINKSGKTIHPFQYEQVSVDAVEGLIEIPETKTRATINPPNAKIYTSTRNYLNTVRDGEFTSKVTTNYRVSDVTYRYKEPAGIATVTKNGKVGYVDAKGKTIVPCKYTRGYNFVDGVALVENNNRFGIVNDKGKEILAPTNYWIGGTDRKDIFFYHGSALVRTKDNWSINLVDKNGKFIFENDYYSLGEPRTGLTRVTNGKQIGYADFRGRFIIPLGEKEVINDTADFSFVVSGGRVGRIDSIYLLD